MDFASIWESIVGRNPMFLAASGSVALGVSLIISAGLVQLKRFRSRSGHVLPVEKQAPPEEVEIVLETGESQADTVKTPELLHLLGRLRAASEKLEKFRATDVRTATQPADSPLKRPPSGVDYIFRAGTG